MQIVRAEVVVSKIIGSERVVAEIDSTSGIVENGIVRNQIARAGRHLHAMGFLPDFASVVRNDVAGSGFIAADEVVMRVFNEDAAQFIADSGDAIGTDSNIISLHAILFALDFDRLGTGSDLHSVTKIARNNIACARCQAADGVFVGFENENPIQLVGYHRITRDIRAHIIALHYGVGPAIVNKEAE